MNSNPALQHYLLILLAASLVVVLAQPDGAYNAGLVAAGMPLAYLLMGIWGRAGRVANTHTATATDTDANTDADTNQTLAIGA